MDTGYLGGGRKNPVWDFNFERNRTYTVCGALARI